MPAVSSCRSPNSLTCSPRERVTKLLLLSHPCFGFATEPAGEVNAKYGSDPGVKFYTHLSDQYGPFHTKVISATTSEAPHVLDGLLHHGTGLSIHEHYTDTGGATVMWTSQASPAGAFLGI
jgi:hypothetical protein